MEILGIIIFILAFSFLFAELETQIEGSGFWAKNLPTWRKENLIYKIIVGPVPLTGYHFYQFLSIFLMLHFPFFLGFLWSVSLELRILGTFVAICFVEDFIYFLVNPNFGWKKFSDHVAPWHQPWFWKFPSRYYLCLFVSTIFFVISYL